jgi:nitrogen fixation NifU-like protein
MLSDMVKGMKIADAYQIRPDDLVKMLGGLPDFKIHCSVLGDKALRAAIDDYLEKHGRKGELHQDAIEICHCMNVTDKDIEKAFNDGARSWEDLQKATKIGTGCGKCKDQAMDLLHEFIHLYT